MCTLEIVATTRHSSTLVVQIFHSYLSHFDHRVVVVVVEEEVMLQPEIFTISNTAPTRYATYDPGHYYNPAHPAENREKGRERARV